MSADVAGSSEALGLIDRRPEGERGQRSHTWHRHQPSAYRLDPDRFQHALRQMLDLTSHHGDSGGSTDVSDISWVSPTVGLGTATWVPGTPAHSWQAVAASGGSIGAKGGVVAAKTLALSAAELFRSPDVLAAARAELDKARGAGFKYQAMVGDRTPPLDYRKPAASQ